MTITQKVKMVLAYANMSEAEMARALGMSPQAFNAKMKTENLTPLLLNEIANAAKCRFICYFETNEEHSPIGK